MDQLGSVTQAEWEARVARYLAMYVSRLSEVRLPDLIELPLIAATLPSTRKVCGLFAYGVCLSLLYVAYACLRLCASVVSDLRVFFLLCVDCVFVNGLLLTHAATR